MGTTESAAAIAARLAPLRAACARQRSIAEAALDAMARLEEARRRDDLTGLAQADQAEARMMDRLADFVAAEPLAAMVDEEVEKLKRLWTREGWTPHHAAELAEALELYCGTCEAVDEVGAACAMMEL